jgi:leucyl-tRNA synthetase
MEQDMQWYVRRTSAKGRENSPTCLAMTAEYLKVQVRMLAPFAPFTAEEVWEKLGNSQTITIAGWPAPDDANVDLASEESEFVVQSLLADLQNITKVTKIVPKKIVLYASTGWKVPAYKTVLANVMEGKTNFGDMMKQLIANPVTAKINPIQTS